MLDVVALIRTHTILDNMCEFSKVNTQYVPLSLMDKFRPTEFEDLQIALMVLCV
jgi:hypothetical protein